METCFRCERSEREVRLLEAIYENEIVKICERCSIVESMPVIRKPSTSQLKESEKSYTVYQRLKKLAGLEKQEKKTGTILDQISKLEENPELELLEKKPFNLIDNFHWHVTRARRNKGLSQRQLGWALGESEAAIRMVEKSQLPEDSEKLMKKLEQFFQIKLIKKTEEELEEEKRKERKREKFKIPKVEKSSPIEIEEIIGEEKTEIKEKEKDELELISSIACGKVAGEAIEKGKETLTPLEVLSFKPESAKSITIDELRKMKEEYDREEKLIEAEEERKKFLLGIRKQELKEQVADEMKDIALGKKVETIGEKRKMLNKAMEKLSKTEEKDHIPTIAELMEKKKDKERASEFE